MKKITMTIATIVMAMVMTTTFAGGNHQAVITKVVARDDGLTSIHYRGYGGTILYQIDAEKKGKWVPVIKGNGRQDRTSTGTRAVTFRLPAELVGAIRVSIYNTAGILMDTNILN